MTESPLPPSWDGSVVLDIGGDVGAMMLRVPPTLDGRELEIQSHDANAPRTHSAVRERQLPGGSIYAAVYPSLQQGSYTVIETGQVFSVTGGKITEIELDTFEKKPTHGDAGAIPIGK